MGENPSIGDLQITLVGKGEFRENLCIENDTTDGSN
jgi:hypothetical protein